MNESKQTKKVIEALKRLLKARGITYGLLAEKIGLSLPSVKRLLSQGEMNLSRLEEICTAAGVQMTELFRMVEMEENSGPVELSLEQEEALAKHPKNFAYFELILGGLSPQQIEKEFRLSAVETARYLSQLQRIGLIEWLPKNKIRLIVSDTIKLRANGPLQAIFAARAMNDFLKGDFRADLAYRDFMLTRLSPATTKDLIQKLALAAKQAALTGEMEANAKIPTEGMGIHIAVRRFRLADSLGL